MGNRDITVIGPKTTLPKAFRRRRVALYARVSTDRTEQENSLAAQIDYFEKRIALNPNWVPAGVFYDDGISGLGYRDRPGFDTMIEQAKTGNIDLILTKSISRFARNTVDTIQTIRDLKAANVEVYFQKEDIFTFESKGEFVLTLMSCFAQEESRSISENVKWGIRKAFADGRYSVPYSRFLGYDKGNMETPLIINNSESLIVKSIILLFLEGFSTTGIASVLTARGIPAPGGKERWHPSTIYSIITNEKYRGDALLQKTYIENFLTKKARTIRRLQCIMIIQSIASYSIGRARAQRRRILPPDSVIFTTAKKAVVFCFSSVNLSQIVFPEVLPPIPISAQQTT